LQNKLLILLSDRACIGSTAAFYSDNISLKADLQIPYFILDYGCWAPASPVNPIWLRV